CARRLRHLRRARRAGHAVDQHGARRLSRPDEHGRLERYAAEDLPLRRDARVPVHGRLLPRHADLRRALRMGSASSQFTSRVAVRADLPALQAVMDAAIAELQRAFLSEAQIASSRAIMGIDTQLLDDGTYFVVECGEEIAGCGGWSRRATMYGSDHTPGRDSRLLDPKTEP